MSIDLEILEIPKGWSLQVYRRIDGSYTATLHRSRYAAETIQVKAQGDSWQSALAALQEEVARRGAEGPR